MKRSGLALSALLLAMAPVHAADLGWNASATSPMYSPTSVAQWTGFYAGISGGYGWGTTVNSPALPGGVTDNNAHPVILLKDWRTKRQIGVFTKDGLQLE